MQSMLRWPSELSQIIHNTSCACMGSHAIVSETLALAFCAEPTRSRAGKLEPLASPKAAGETEKLEGKAASRRRWWSWNA